MLTKKISSNFNYPYFVNEDEIRCELINTIFEKVQGIELWDCRHTPCPDPYYYKGFPFVPPTGDILYRRNGVLGTIELKFARLRATAPKSSTGGRKHAIGAKLHYLMMKEMDLTLLQLEFLKKGLLTLILVGEKVSNFKKWGIIKEGKSLSEIEDDMKKLRELFGNERIPYTYIIVNNNSLSDYEGYLNSLKPSKMTVKGKTVGYKLRLSFPKIVDVLTPSEKQEYALRSRLSQEIRKRLFGI